MTTLATVTSRHNPIVRRFRDAAARHGSPDVMLLDGGHLVQEAVQAGVQLTAVAATPAALTLPDIDGLVARARRGGAEAFQVPENLMEAMSPVRTPSGVVALARRPRASLVEALERRPALVVCPLDVQDPGNVGAIVRAAEAGGATAVVFAGTCADPFSWKALRGSMGSAFRMTVASANAEEVVAGARMRGVRVLAAVPRGGSSPQDVDLRQPSLLLLGGEGPGLSDDIVASADERVTIPMRPPVESLNVAVAAALLVYEAARQRQGQI